MTCMSLFYVFYKLLLESEKMLVFNRLFLLSSLIGAHVIPFITVITYTSNAPDLFFVPEVFSSQLGTSRTNEFDMSSVVIGAYSIVTVFFLIRFVKGIWNLYEKISLGEVIRFNGVAIVLTGECKLPYTFLNYVVVQKQKYLNNKIDPLILQHEYAHAKQFHTYDILIVEILKVLFWFNPFIYVFKKAVKLNHEYLADQSVLREFSNVTSYQLLLLNMKNWTPRQTMLVSNINNSVTKKRFKMMSKKTFSTIAFLKASLTIALFASAVFLFGEKVSAQHTGATDAEIKEYKELLNNNFDENGRIGWIDKKDVKRMNEIYAKMSQEQKKAFNAKTVPPPPPPPPPPPALERGKTTAPTAPTAPVAPQHSEGMSTPDAPPPPPPPPPFPDDATYFLDGKPSNKEAIEKVVKEEGRDIKLKSINNNGVKEFHVVRNKTARIIQ